MDTIILIYALLFVLTIAILVYTILSVIRTNKLLSSTLVMFIDSMNNINERHTLPFKKEDNDNDLTPKILTAVPPFRQIMDTEITTIEDELKEVETKLDDITINRSEKKELLEQYNRLISKLVNRFMQMGDKNFVSKEWDKLDDTKTQTQS